MNKLTVLLAAAILIITSTASAQTSKGSKKGQAAKNIPYKEYNNYFLKNDYTSEQRGFEITNEGDLNLMFGAAAINQKFSGIDFSKQMGIAIILPRSEKDKDIVIKSVRYDGKNILLSYSVKTAKAGATAHNWRLIAVDIKYKSAVKVVQ